MATIPVKNKRPINITGTVGERLFKLIDVVSQIWDRLNDVIYEFNIIKNKIGNVLDLKYLEAKVKELENTKLENIIEDTTPQLGGNLDTNGNSIILNTTRVTSSPYTILSTDFVIFVDTDGGAITVNLPAGSEGYNYRIINCGSSGNDVTVTPDGIELLDGVNSSKTLSDGSIVDLIYNATEGWR